MLELIKKIVKYQYLLKNEENSSSIIFSDIINDIDQIIHNKIKYVNKNDKLDIYQEIIYKIDKCIRRFRIKKYQYDEKYIRSFQNTYNKLIFNYYEYNLFCNEQQLYKYLNRLITNQIIDYKRKKLKKHVKVKTKQTKDNIYKTIIEYYANSSSKNKLLILEFAFLFIEDNKTLTETEVARKLNVTRQAINKRKHKIFGLIKKDIIEHL